MKDHWKHDLDVIKIRTPCDDHQWMVEDQARHLDLKQNRKPNAAKR